MAPSVPPADDPTGIFLWEERLRSVPGWLAQMRTEERPEPEALDRGAAIVCSGLGSSEGHARFCNTLLQKSGHRSRFMSVDTAFQGDGTVESGTTLIHFSQGLSPNAQILLRRRQWFGRVLLFTACTEESLTAAGKADRAALLRELQEAGVELWPLAPAEEFTLLIRCLGPLDGYLEVMRAGSRLGFPAELPDAAALEQTLSEALREGMELGGRMKTPLTVVLPGGIAEYAQNLGYKWVEGLFEEPPLVTDPLTLVHGGFQLRCHRPGDLLYLQCAGGGPDLAGRLEALWRKTGGAFFSATAPWAEPAAILFFEHLLNGVVWRRARDLGVNQIDWPGKGRDGEVYGLNRPDRK